MEDLQEELYTSPSKSSSSVSSSLNFSPLPIDAELWLLAEERIQEILCAIQPALVSEKKRKEVIDYVQRLINGYHRIEVFPFGSVPLKTYLPDGDIDLTVLSHQIAEEDLARFVCEILENENQDAVFQLKDVQYVPAQVKIVKCSVQNIPVDISFNQLAGLSALCFLEKVDQLIGKDHLFKRSIILIKAWCYYESRILGAHCGLISTYALEIMVLHVINLFHSSLCGPLAVLRRFLDYFSTFDWDSYCISINGPVSITSLPAETLQNNGEELLLSQEFLQKCREIYAVPLMALETIGHDFSIKHLNILDPLKDSNNLGRSVSKGNLHRIKCALSYGAQRLEEIFTLPGHCVGMGLEKFFMNTLERNGKGQRPDVQVPIHAFGSGKSAAADLSGDYDRCYSGLLYGQSYHDYTWPVTAPFRLPSFPSGLPCKSAYDALCQFAQDKENLVNQWATEAFVPRLPFRHPYASQVRVSTFSTDEGDESQGPGTYIPDLTCPPPKDMLVRERDPESLNHVPVYILQRNNVHNAHFPEKGNFKNGCALNLSLEEFPLLPISKNLPPSGISHRFDQSCDKCAQGGNNVSPVTTIMFGTCEHSQVPSVSLPLPAMMEDPGASNIMDSESGHSKKELQTPIIIQKS